MQPSRGAALAAVLAAVLMLPACTWPRDLAGERVRVNGSPLYRTCGSYGCVHMPLRAIRFLYRWADIGAPVRIRP